VALEFADAEDGDQTRIAQARQMFRTASGGSQSWAAICSYASEPCCSSSS